MIPKEILNEYDLLKRTYRKDMPYVQENLLWLFMQGMRKQENWHKYKQIKER